MAEILSFARPALAAAPTRTGLDRRLAEALPAGFRLWTGRSGRRHVFTRLDPHADPADLDGAVLAVAAPDGAGDLVIERLIDPADLAPLPPGRSLWAHFLADDEGARSRLRHDLVASPEERFAPPARAA